MAISGPLLWLRSTDPDGLDPDLLSCFRHSGAGRDVGFGMNIRVFCSRILASFRHWNILVPFPDPQGWSDIEVFLQLGPGLWDALNDIGIIVKRHGNRLSTEYMIGLELGCHY